MTFPLWLKIGIKLFSVIIPVITPEIRKIMEEAIRNLYNKAVATDNIWDDFAVKVIADLLRIDLGRNE